MSRTVPFLGRRRPRRTGNRTGRGPDAGTTLKFLVFVTLTGLLTFFIGQQILATSFTPRYRITATFDDVTGLLEGDVVKVSGAPVGQVESIAVRRGKAVVGIAVDRDVRVPDDSTAAIRWRNVMGQRVVYLEPGRSPRKLGDGGRITRTRSVVDLGEIVNSLGPLTRNLDPEQVNKILFAFTEMLDGNERDIELLVRNFDALLQTFDSRRGMIERLIDDYETVSAAVATRDKQIAASVRNLRELTGVFAGNHRLLENAVVEVAGVTTNLNHVLGGNDAQLARIIDNLGRFSETFRLNVDQLEKMVRDLPLTLRQLFATVNGGHFLRANALCINVVQGPCPFPMTLPKSPGDNAPTQRELDKLRSMLRGGR